MNSTPHDIPATVSRRTVLVGAMAGGTALALGGAAVLGSARAFAAAVSPDDFLQLSQFLTGGKPLAAALAPRYQASLARHDPTFEAKAAALQQYVSGAKAASIDELLAREDLAEPLRKTITQIVSAWYMGIVGNDSDVEMVSYAQALMYRPTLDVLVVPTYGGGPDSWGQKPASISVVPNEKKKTP